MKNSFLAGLLIFTTFVGCVSSSQISKSGESVESILKSTLVAKEKEVWEAYRRRDAKALDTLTADDSYSIEDADGGIITKEQSLKSLSNLAITDYTMQNFALIPINPGAAILRYSVRVSGSSNGEQFTPHWSTVSSIWVKRKGKWQNLLYQETEVRHHH